MYKDLIKYSVSVSGSTEVLKLYWFCKNWDRVHHYSVISDMEAVCQSEAPPGGVMRHVSSPFTHVATFTVVVVVLWPCFFFFVVSLCCSWRLRLCVSPHSHRRNLPKHHFLMCFLVLPACRGLQRLRLGHDGGGLLRHPGRSSVQQ